MLCEYELGTWFKIPSDQILSRFKKYNISKKKEANGDDTWTRKLQQDFR